MPFYHCTKPEDARSIETGGFTTSYSWDSFRHYADDYAEIYGPETYDEIRTIHRFLDEAEDHKNAEEASRWRHEPADIYSRQRPGGTSSRPSSDDGSRTGAMGP